MHRLADGRNECQVRGCNEPAMPWATIVDLDDELPTEIYFCRRHELIYSGSTRTKAVAT
jgi:hypothetical protein